MTPAEQAFQRFRSHGDARALGAVFDALAPELLLVAAHVAPRGVDAEDLLQSAFLEAIEHAARWDPARPLVPWLIGILVNHVRRERQRLARQVDAARLDPRQAPSPLDVAELKDIGVRIEEALANLPRQYRQALVLRLVHGLTPTQIALALGCPIATVKSRLQRGLERLRRTLPAGVGATLVAITFAERGLAAVRTAVVAKAALTTAAATATATLTLGIAMKKTLVAGTIAVLAVATWIAASGSATPVVATTPPAEPVPIRAAAPPGKRNGIPDAPARQPAVEGGAETAATMTVPLLRGRVIDPSGAGLPDVTIGLARATPDGDYSSYESFRRARSGDPDLNLPPERERRSGNDGSFTFDRDLVEDGAVLAAWSPERGGVLVPVPADLDAEVTLVVADHAALFGRITDEHGLPVAGVYVNIYPNRSGMPVGGIVTDPDGRYRSVPLPPGPYRIGASSPRHEDCMIRVELGIADLRADLEFIPLPVLDLLLVDPSELPITAARIADRCGIEATAIDVVATPQSCARRVDTTSDGRRPVSLAFDPATGRVTGPVTQKDIAFVSLWWRGARLAETELPSLDTEQLVMQLARPVLANLRIRLAFDPHPDRPPTTHVRLERPRFDYASMLQVEAGTTTDNFEAGFAVAASEAPTAWWLIAAADGYVPTEMQFEWPAGNEPLLLDVRLSAASRTLDGVILGADDSPLEAALIHVIAPDGSFVAQRKRVVARSDRTGAFRLESLPARSLRVLVDADDRGVAAIDVPLDADSPLRVHLLPGTPITLVAEREGGSQFRVLDGLGRTLLDDRITGTERFGGPSVMTVPGDAQRAEAYRPGHPRPFMVGSREAGSDRIVLQPLEASDR